MDMKFSSSRKPGVAQPAATPCVPAAARTGMTLLRVVIPFSFLLSMIFSENRYALSRIML
jgi:hypothetical protein